MAVNVTCRYQSGISLEQIPERETDALPEEIAQDNEKDANKWTAKTLAVNCAVLS